MTAYGSSPLSTRLGKVGLANGCWDLFHAGHRRFLWEAKQACDFLIVGVNDDFSIRRAKGPGRPYDRIGTRMDHVTAYANLTVQFDGDARDLARMYRPNLIIRGYDQEWFDCWQIVPFLYVVPHYVDISTTEIAHERNLELHQAAGG